MLNEYAFLFPEISFFNGIYETLPFKNYATLWCRAWRISYDMSFAHDEDKFCEKKYNMHSQWAKTNMHFYAQRLCIFIPWNFIF